LLESGANVNSADKDNVTALALAANHNHYETARTLLQYHADPNIANKSGETVLTNAAQEGNWDIVKLILRQSPGTVSLRARNSNHLMKPQHKLALVHSGRMLNVENNYWSAFNKALTCGRQDVVDAFWCLEVTRQKLRIASPRHFARLAKKTEDKRTTALVCYKWADKRRGGAQDECGGGLATMVRHPLHDFNVWRIVLNFV
jgi:hypothetical protein